MGVVVADCVFGGNMGIETVPHDFTNPEGLLPHEELHLGECGLL